MSNKSEAIAYVDQYIYENHDQLVTGPVLNAVLKYIFDRIAWADDQNFESLPILIESADISNNEYLLVHNFNTTSPLIILYDKNGNEVGPTAFNRNRANLNTTTITCMTELAPYVGIVVNFQANVTLPQWQTIINEDFSSWGGSPPLETLSTFDINTQSGNPRDSDFTVGNDSNRAKFEGWRSGDVIYLDSKDPLEDAIYRFSIDVIDKSVYDGYLIWAKNMNKSTRIADDILTLANPPGSYIEYQFTGIAGRYFTFYYIGLNDDMYAIIDNIKLEKFIG